VLGISTGAIPNSANSMFGWGGALAIADMNADGFPEISYGSTVFTTHVYDMTLAFTGALGTGQFISTFANLAGGTGAQLVAGNTAYEATGAVRWYRGNLPDGFDAIADFDGDGSPDVALIAFGSIYILDGRTGATKLGPATIPGSGTGGPPTIADFDNDGKPELGVAMAGTYSVLKPDFTAGEIRVLWQKPTHDLGSSVTGSTAFDFDGDGRRSVIYSDECFLWVFDGPTGEVRFATPHTSFTANEEPVVADVSGDRHAEIVMVSNAGDPKTFGCVDANGVPVMVDGHTWQPSASIDGAYRGITVFEHAGKGWSRASTLWTEHTFHVTNISDGSGAMYPGLSYGGIPTTETSNWQVPGLNDFRENVDPANLLR
jgi:hypothetical protein